MISFLGRSIGPWGILSAVLGAAVIIPSVIALGFAILAVVSL